MRPAHHDQRHQQSCAVRHVVGGTPKSFPVHFFVYIPPRELSFNKT